MKMNMEVFKKGKPIYWIIGAIVIFVIFYMIASSGSKAKTSTSPAGVTTISTGPSDAQVAAAAGISAAQIQANAQVAGAQLALVAQQDSNAAGVAINNMGFQAQMYETGASADVAKYIGNLDATIQMAGITAQQNMTQINAEYSFATARVAAESNVATQQIQADVMNNSFLTQLEMARGQNATTIALSDNQTRAFTTAALVSGIGQVKPNDRDNMLALIAAGASNSNLTYRDSSSGSFTIN